MKLLTVVGPLGVLIRRIATMYSTRASVVTGRLDANSCIVAIPITANSPGKIIRDGENQLINTYRHILTVLYNFTVLFLFHFSAAPYADRRSRAGNTCAMECDRESKMGVWFWAYHCHLMICLSVQSNRVR